MIFFSRAREYRMVLKGSRYQHMKVSGRDEVEKVPEWGITCHFKPLKQQGLPLKGKLWRGKLDTETDLKEALLYHPDVTEQEIIMGLMQRPEYGEDYIAFGEDGGEAFEDEAFLESAGDGSFICHACEQMLKNAQGIPGHFGSEKHKTNRAKYITEVRKKFKL